MGRGGGDEATSTRRIAGIFEQSWVSITLGTTFEARVGERTHAHLHVTRFAFPDEHVSYGSLA